jgi:short-subunit dehydrogenase
MKYLPNALIMKCCKIYAIINLLKILQNKTSSMRKLMVVTGGSKGIGRAVAEKFARHGFDVATCARHENELLQLQQDIIKSVPEAKVFYKPADMSRKEEVTAFTEYIRSLNREVTVLVNNAGYFVPGEICTEPDGTLESMIDANLYSAYHTTRGVVAGMKRKKSGHIFNICSIASIKAYANGGSYAISKFAMLGFSKCLREELKNDHIRVTAVMPGATRTRSWEGVDLPDERFMTTQDVADTIFAAWSLSSRSVVEEIIIRPQLGDI